MAIGVCVLWGFLLLSGLSYLLAEATQDRSWHVAIVLFIDEHDRLRWQSGLWPVPFMS
jgi:hypothetical protein